MNLRSFLGTLSLFATFVTTIAVAHAAPTPIIVAPSGWSADPEQAAAIISHAAGDQKPAVEVYVPRQPGVALIASRFSAPASGDAARGAIDDLYGAADRAKIISTNVSVLERTDHYDADRKEVVATQSVKGDTTTVSRLVIAMDATHITAALGECVIRDDASALLVEACKAALVTLDPAIANRVAIVVPASSAVVLEVPAPSHPAPRQPTMSDGSHMPMPPIVVAEDTSSSKDRRPVWVGAGLVVLAIVFWWNRRMRDRFEREDKGKTDKPPTRGETDADADDLHAAAKGETSDE